MRVGLAVVCIVGHGIQAYAQDPSAPSLSRHHVSVGGGLIWTGGYQVGDTTVQLRGNGVGPSAPAFTLLRADTSLDAAFGGALHAGYALSSSITLEVGVGFSRPGLTTRITEDPEVSPTTLDAERLLQITAEVGATWQLPRPVLAGRLRPFVSAGAGYLRQLYDERTLVETGRLYYAGGGVRAFLRGGDGRRRALGVRADARAVWRQDGVEFEGRTRVMPRLGVQLFTEF